MIFAAAGLVLAFPTPASAYSTFADGVGNCQIIGDSDVFGLGIRLSYYLQWIAVVFATWWAPDEVRVARLFSSFVTIAVYINTFLGVTVDSVIAAEWWIVYFLTFVLTFGYIPSDRKSLQGSVCSLGVWGPLWLMIVFAQCWVWFKGIDIEQKEGCVVKIFAIFFEVDVYDEGWQMFFKIQSVISCISAVLFLIGGVKINFFQREPSDVDNPMPKLLKSGLILFQLIVGALAVLQIEMTIRINNISVSGAPVTSSGQLIPIIAGTFTTLRTIGICFKSQLKAIAQRCRTINNLLNPPTAV